MSAISHKVNSRNDLVNDYLGGVRVFLNHPRFTQKKLPAKP